MVAVRAMTFGWLVLLPRETSDMPMLTEHWSASIIDPGIFCTNYNDRMTAKINKEKGRKSTIKFKRRRAQKHLSSNAETSRKQAKEGTTYESGVGLNLNTDKNTTNSTEPVLAKDTSEPEIPKCPSNVGRRIQNNRRHCTSFHSSTTSKTSQV